MAVTAATIAACSFSFSFPLSFDGFLIVIMVLLCYVCVCGGGGCWLLAATVDVVVVVLLLGAVFFVPGVLLLYGQLLEMNLYVLRNLFSYLSRTEVVHFVTFIQKNTI